MTINKANFGTLSTGEKVTKFVLQNDAGLSISAIDYGATLTSVVVPDRNRTQGEVTLGFDSIDGYEGEHPYFGATIGRYANRISKGTFTLSRKTYSLFVNANGIHLHGGKSGFNRKMWTAEIEAERNKGIIRFHRVSPDGEEQYPGNLDVTLAFILTDENELFFDYTATTDKPTPVNLTNHAYWNLAGPGRPIYDHLLILNSDRYLETDEKTIPTGKLLDVNAAGMDFREERAIGRGIAQFDGYDHCFVLLKGVGDLRAAARVKDPSSGRCMSVETNQPAIQFYTSTSLKDTRGRGGITYKKHGAFCLEAGAYTDAVNNPSFPNSILKPGEVYRHVTRHTFWSE